MNVTSLVLVRGELQDHGDDGDDGGAQDGHGVVHVVPGHLSGPEVVNLPEPQPDIETETSQPEEDGESGELEEEARDDTSAGVCHKTRMELVPDYDNQEGEREEEEEGDLDGGHVVVPELVTGAVADDDDDDAHDADGHHDQLGRGPHVIVGVLVAAHHRHVLCLLDAIVIELIKFVVDDSLIVRVIPMFLGPEVCLPSLAMQLRVDISVVVTTFIIRLSLSLFRRLARVVSHDGVFWTAEIDTWFILGTWKTLLSS